MNDRTLRNVAKLAVVLPVTLLLLAHCNQIPDTDWEIVEISKIPDPALIPYPNGAAVCLLRNQEGEQVLAAIPAITNRKVRDDFQNLSPGQNFSAKLIPWAERPPKARAMFVANDLEDYFELRIYFAAK